MPRNTRFDPDANAEQARKPVECFRESLRRHADDVATCARWYGGRAVRTLAAGALAVVLLCSFAAPAALATEAGLLRYPDIHRDFVVFVYAGDLWRAPTDGSGKARRLTAHPGLELFPKISLDGRFIAYTAEYSGTRQVYVMPANGGPPRQLTYYTDVGVMPPRGGYDNWILDWTEDGKILVRMNRTPWGVRMGRYYLVDPDGGLEMPLELPEGGGASLSPDGRKIAYTPVSREFRTWKRTRGGRAQDIWLYDFDERRSTRLTDSRATENFPMWSGDSVYYTSDEDGTLNLRVHDLTTGDDRALTSFQDFDVLWPSLGPESIVFARNGLLHRMPLDGDRWEPIPVSIASALPAAVPHWRSVAEDVDEASLSPSGVRVVLGARGDLFSVPAKNGPTHNLTRTAGTRELSPAWSPDGRRIAYLSDATGEYEIWIRGTALGDEARQVTSDGSVWRFAPAWSPDSKKLAFADRDRRLWILDAEDGSLREVDRGDRHDLTHHVWSPDSRWLAYGKDHATRLNGIMLYSVEDDERYRLGDGLTADYEPVFSADGQWLFFLSDRDYNITFSAFEFDYLYTRAGRVYVAALHPDAATPFPPRNDEEPADDEEEGSTDDEGENENGDKDGADDEPPRLETVDPGGWTARIVALPGIPSGNYAGLAATGEAVFYLRTDHEGSTALYRYDLEARKEAKVLDGVRGYELSHDDSKLLYRTADGWGIVEPKADVPSGEGKLSLDGLRMKIEPRAEWEQIYRDAWRITRDWFYDPQMHGKDWDALGRRYGEAVPLLGDRHDLDFLLGELIAELDAGHTYVVSGAEPYGERVEGGTLGCELEPDGEAGRYRITKIYGGENWDDRFRSPLTEPGVDAREGDYLLAVDGEPIDLADNPYRFLEGKSGTHVLLSLSATGKADEARDVTVRPLAGDGNLRYLDWVRGRMKLADELSDGRVGYIHLPNTAFDGNRMLQKLFFSQVAKPALIVDDRYNGGGFIPDRMIEYLGRRTLVYWARRDVESMRTPAFAHDGPKAMLINAYSSSGGDALPYFFRKRGLGTLIGTRTWGGLIGLSGNPSFVDGGAVLIPSFRMYDDQGRWVVENEGVAPDIEVFDLPEARIRGGDPSLEKAVEILLEGLESRPAGDPDPPTPPDMSRSPR